MSITNLYPVSNARTAFVAQTAIPIAHPRPLATSSFPRSSFLASVPAAPRTHTSRYRRTHVPLTCTANFDPHPAPMRQPPTTLPSLPVVSPRTWGRIQLTTVPILWASYSIIVKYMYTMPWAFGPATFNALRLVLSIVPLFPSIVRYMRDRVRQKRANKTALLTPTIVGGLELGAWTCAMNTLQLIGLRYTAASRGAFLTQLCTVIVPVAAFATGAEPTLARNVIVASLLSVFGVGLLTLDDVASPFSWLGDGSLLLSAFVSAVYVMRCKTFAERSDGGPMVAFKVLAQMVCAIVYLCVVNASALVSWTGVRAAVANAFVGVTPWALGVNIFFMLFTGLLLSVGSTIIQIRGQKMVSASEAVIIFTSTPLWTALMAIPLGERFGLRGIAGAFLIFVATMICSKPEKKGQVVKSS